MAAPFSTIALDADTWDVAVVGGSFKVLSGADAIAQDMSTACRLFLGEYPYDATVGIPFLTIFGETTSLPILKSDYATAASAIPGTSNVQCFIESIQDRCVNGQVQATVQTDAGIATVAVPTSGNIQPLVFAPILTGGPGGSDLTGGPGGFILTGGSP